MIESMFTKKEIEKYSRMAYEYMDGCRIEICGDIDENGEEMLIADFDENTVYCGNCFDGFFEQILICRLGDKLFVEIQKLGDCDGFYKDWSIKKYMQTMYETCEDLDNIWVSNYEYDDTPQFRAFFVAFLFDLKDVRYYEEIYKYCHSFCDQLDLLVEQRIKGYCWNEIFEKDEMSFCKMFLTPFFKRLGFEQVIFNHGNKEFGKDYILVTKNIFGLTEYYGVQAKAGNLSGTATSSINEIANQIDMGFTIPYTLVDGKKNYISKMIIAISGNFTENAKEIIQNYVDKYKFPNLIFLSKKELENHIVFS